jgi:heme exporter protein D
VARAAFSDGGNYARLQWPSLAVAVVCVVVMLLISALRERDVS